MITHSFVEQITEKTKNVYIYFFIFIMVCLGIIINNIQPYPKFLILFPILVIMSLSTVMLLKYCLNIMIEFKTQCDQMQIFEDALKVLLVTNKSPLIIFIYCVIMVTYFLCLYNLQFINLNIMGFYILLCGISTLGMALAAYEIYIRLTITLYRVVKDEESLSQNYNKFSPSNTSWLQKLHQLSRVLKNASLIMGLLFVFENTMIFFANIDKLNQYINNQNLSFWKKMCHLPLEFWLIWVLVCIAIALAFPLVAIIQSINMKNIIYKIENFYNLKATKDFEESSYEKQLFDWYILMNLMQNVEMSLNEKYLTPKVEKFIVILASFLTCLIHFATLYNLFL